jgi:hypothetical protein
VTTVPSLAQLCLSAHVRSVALSSLVAPAQFMLELLDLQLRGLQLLSLLSMLEVELLCLTLQQTLLELYLALMQVRCVNHIGCGGG